MSNTKMAKFCANLGFLFTENNSSIGERFRLAKKAGFKAVESPLPSNINFDDTVTAYKETGIKVVLLNTYNGTHQFGCASFPDSISDFKENLATSVKYAKALNCKKIHIMAGQLPDGSTVANHKTYLENLKYAAGILEPENITGVIEPICSYGVPRYYLDSVEQAVDIIHQVNSPNIRLQFDFYHIQHLCGNITNNLKDLMPIIGNVQIAQVPGRNEPNTEGELEFGYLLRKLEEFGYTDWIGCEYKPKSNSVDSLKWIKTYGFSL